MVEVTHQKTKGTVFPICPRITEQERDHLCETHPYKVSGNADQIAKHFPDQLSSFRVEPLKVGTYIDNRVSARFTSKEEANALYQQLLDHKLVAFKNWSS